MSGPSVQPYGDEMTWIFVNLTRAVSRVQSPLITYWQQSNYTFPATHRSSRLRWSATVQGKNRCEPSWSGSWSCTEWTVSSTTPFGSKYYKSKCKMANNVVVQQETLIIKHGTIASLKMVYVDSTGKPIFSAMTTVDSHSPGEPKIDPRQCKMRNIANEDGDYADDGINDLA